MRTLFAPLSILLFNVESYAATQTIMFAGVGSGSIGTTNFVDAAFKVTAIGDTANRQQFPATDVYYIDHSEASIEIDGIGTFVFAIPTQTLLSNTFRIVAFSAQFESTDLVQLRDNAPLSSWDMLDSIGPLTGSGRILGWSRLSVLTDAGVLALNDAEGIGMTFSATVIPEPSSMILIANSILFLGIRRRWFPIRQY